MALSTHLSWRLFCSWLNAPGQYLQAARQSQARTAFHRQTPSAVLAYAGACRSYLLNPKPSAPCLRAMGCAGSTC